ncbi:MAG: SMC-Scp complex subunit ScpB [Clostridiales bacterium]|nr:SMC-Scp complex subunit ScpB [Clostridiales bacterium]
MQINQEKAIIEAILFAAGRPVTKNEIMLALEISEDEIEKIIANMQEEYNQENRGIELIKINNSYQLCTKKELYEYVYPILDKRTKPNLSTASLETLAIIAYNPKITRAEIENIRGVSADACVYKLLEYGLIEEAGKLDLPGKPMSYQTTDEFLRMFGFSSLEELPELPRYKLDENKQIVIDDLINNEQEEQKINTEEQENGEEKPKENVIIIAQPEAPMPERGNEEN